MGLLLGDELVRAADTLAVSVHQEQWYAPNHPYIDHVRDAASLARAWGYRHPVLIGALLLHDSMEMSKPPSLVTRQGLRLMRFPLVMIEGIEGMTLLPSEEMHLTSEEKRTEKIARARKHPVSHVGKPFDSLVNLATNISDPYYLESKRPGKAKDNTVRYVNCVHDLLSDIPSPEQLDTFIEHEIAKELAFPFEG